MAKAIRTPNIKRLTKASPLAIPKISKSSSRTDLHGKGIVERKLRIVDETSPDNNTQNVHKWLQRINQKYSTAIKRVFYDWRKLTLYLTFPSGETYAYYGVPMLVLQGLANTPSLGIFFNMLIKYSYSWNKANFPYESYSAIRNVAKKRLG